MLQVGQTIQTDSGTQYRIEKLTAKTAVVISNGLPCYINLKVIAQKLQEGSWVII